MNTDSFKKRQQLFQSGSSQSNVESKFQPNTEAKPRLSSSYMNKDLFEPKSKNNIPNLSLKKTITQDNPNSSQIKVNPNSNILKIASQLENKKKMLNEESKKKNSIQIDEKTDVNVSKDNLLKKNFNIEKSKSEANKLERFEKKEKENENKKIEKNEKKEENKEIKKENDKKDENKEIKKENEKKDENKDVIKEEMRNKIEEIKKQMEKAMHNKEEMKKENEIKISNKKEDKINENIVENEIKKDEINENKKDNKKNEKSKIFEKEKKEEKLKDTKKINNEENVGDISIKNENSNKAPNLNKEKDKERDKGKDKEKENNIFKNNIFLSKAKSSPSNVIKKKELKAPNINLNQEKIVDKNKPKNIFEALYSEPDPLEDKTKNKIIAKTLSDLEIDNFKDFKEEDYSERKYDKSTIDKGKIFFKYRYLKNKYTQINETIRRLSTVNNNNINNIPIDSRTSAVQINKLNIGKFNSANSAINTNKVDRNTINVDIDNKFKLSNNIHLSFFIQNPSSQCLNSIDKDSELRHYHSQFLQITEKSILCFNLKKYEESYLYLLKNKIIKNLEEFGEFLLVVNGFDKSVIGNFLSTSHAPNDKKEVLRSFITAVKMNYNEINFLECFRFFMKRLYLPKDANLILEIMNEFSEIYFEANKSNKEFVNIFKNSNNIYLLISTLLAANTMFTRTDIKNINIIKKEEFVTMNKDIQEKIVINIYDELAKKPFLIDNENYNENIYKRMTALVKEKISSKGNLTLMKSKTITSVSSSLLKKLDENPNLIINEDSDEDNESSLQSDLNLSDQRSSSNLGSGGGSRPFMRSSFSLTKNLYSFTNQDQELLSKIQKFNKLVGKGMLHEREFLVSDNFTKLKWCKGFEQNKVKGNLHCLLITDIYDVFNGIEHSENLKKYINANPKEAKEKNNFITIITNKRQINLKSDSLLTSLLWYKALKSLVLKTKNENMKKNSKSENKKNRQFKLQLEELWKDFILPKWNIYGNYILVKLKKKNKIESKKEINNPKNIDTIIKDTENDKILEFSDFFQFFYLGLPSFCRGTIWRLLIGNACYITESLYDSYLLQVEPQNFKNFDVKYHEDINTIFNREYNINQMIADVIKTKDYFSSDLIQLNIDQDKIMAESYNILRVFFLMRSDLVYKKSIVPLIYVFLMVDENEYNAFCNVYNLICNSDIIKFYIVDEDYIIKTVSFFNNLVKKYLPKIHQHFTNLEIEHELYFIPWITEIFSSSMSYKLLLRVLDLYLINGEYIIFQIGLSILAVQEDDLLDLAINEIFKILKKLSSKQKEDLFLEKMKSFENVKEEFNKWKNENELGLQKLQLFQAIFNDDK